MPWGKARDQNVYQVRLSILKIVFAIWAKSIGLWYLCTLNTCLVFFHGLDGGKENMEIGLVARGQYIRDYGLFGLIFSQHGAS